MNPMVGVYIPIIRIPVIFQVGWVDHPQYKELSLDLGTYGESVHSRTWTQHHWGVPFAARYLRLVCGCRGTLMEEIKVEHVSLQDMGFCWYVLIGVCRHPGSEWVQNPLMFLKKDLLIFMIHCESVFRKGPMNLSLSGGFSSGILTKRNTVCLIGQTYCAAQHSRLFQSYYLPGDSIRDLFSTSWRSLNLSKGHLIQEFSTRLL